MVNILIRIIWFVTVGWILGALWFGIGILLRLTYVFGPIGTKLMMHHAPKIATMGY